jgi:hypothetical protein
MNQCDSRILVIALDLVDSYAASGFVFRNADRVPPDPFALKPFRNSPEVVI